MERIQLRLCHVLFIITLFYTTGGTTQVCEDWDPHGVDEVCCNRCSPGYRMVERCGKNLDDLCAPCGPNTYIHQETPPKWQCKTCTQCIGPQIVEKPCTASVDTVCGCISGFRCGNKECGYCVTECKEGEEPTNERTCRKCPKGKFNDKIHSTCKPWSKSCPEGERIIANGNAFSDIKCGKTPEITTPSTKETTTQISKKPRNDNSDIYGLIALYGGISALLIIFILSLFLALQRIKIKSKSKDLKPKSPTQGELTIMVVAHEEPCSFHQPEQEQGGSSESINTQNSETKLIV